MNAGRFCAEQGAAAGSHFYYACRYQRDAEQLHPLLALHNALSKLIFQHNDAAAARQSLSWWYDELARLGQGQAHHPVTVRLQQHGMPIDLGLFAASLHACDKFLCAAAPASYDDWQQRHQRRCQAIAVHIAACSHGQDHTYAAEVGKALALASHIEQLHHLHRLIAAGRPPLPAQLLRQHEVTPALLTQQAADRRCSILLRQLLKHLQADLCDCQDALANDRSNQQAFARVLCGILLAQVKAYLASDKNIMQEHIALSPLRKLWIAWYSK